jgi:RimJ/RimL family protein N-acetyltransferase
VAENQEGNLKDCQRSGFSEYAGWYNARNLFSCLGKGLVKLSSYKTRLGHSRQGMRLVDGKGAARIVNVLLDKSSIFLRKARKSDCYDLWLWRNHARARRWSFNKDKIPYAMHKAWFNRKIKDKHSYIYIAQNCRGKKVGQIRFELNNKSAYVNVNLNPDFFGKGLGSKIIREGTQLFLKEHPSVKIILAEVINSNIASKKAFQKAGYVHDKL